MCCVFLCASIQIRVNAVNPTVVMTDMGKLGWSDPNKAGPMLNRIPLQRFSGKFVVFCRECNKGYVATVQAYNL